ncbi:MAG TPA: ABC transporter substrate-binding protein, partial [Saprospiraceae bacterium]|nr:ABC transporter substrate-binding protein [Saprospiraceae bacterium]
MKKIKATAVNYLNTKPLLYGILKSGLNELIELQTDIPSECARKLKAGEVDFALVPVAVIPELTTPAIISDYCIGTVGAVKTVVIFSEKPLHEVDEIYLDYQSRTSVELTKILLKNYWKIAPKLIAGSPGF